jgi:hypothetical protein
MDKEKIIQQAQQIIEGVFKVLSIDNVNHKPHPYCIGPKHLKYASDRHSNVLSEDVIREGEKKGVYCAVPGCTLDYDEHTSNTVMMIQLVRHAHTDEVQELLNKVNKVIDGTGIEGYTLVDTPEKYRITKTESHE